MQFYSLHFILRAIFQPKFTLFKQKSAFFDAFLTTVFYIVCSCAQTLSGCQIRRSSLIYSDLNHKVWFMLMLLNIQNISSSFLKVFTDISGICRMYLARNDVASNCLLAEIFLSDKNLSFKVFGNF